MEDLLQSTLDSAAVEAGIVPPGAVDGLMFLVITTLGLVMALVYVPVRLFLTITARSRRLKLLQRIRRLRDDLGQPIVRT